MSLGDRKNIHFRTKYIGTFKPGCWAQMKRTVFGGNIANEERGDTMQLTNEARGDGKLIKKDNYLFIWGLWFYFIGLHKALIFHCSQSV